jgi:hypothetical protein
VSCAVQNLSLTATAHEVSSMTLTCVGGEGAAVARSCQECN